MLNPYSDICFEAQETILILSGLDWVKTIAAIFYEEDN